MRPAEEATSADVQNADRPEVIPKLSQNDIRVLRRELLHAVWIAYPNPLDGVQGPHRTQGLVIKFAVQACIKQVLADQKKVPLLDPVKASRELLDERKRDDLVEIMESIVEDWLDTDNNNCKNSTADFNPSTEEYSILNQEVINLPVFINFFHCLDNHDSRRTEWMKIATKAEEDAAADAVDAAKHGLPAGLHIDPAVVGPRNPPATTGDSVVKVVEDLRATTRLLHAAIIALGGQVPKAATPKHMGSNLRVYQREFFEATEDYALKTEPLPPSEKLSKSSANAYQSEELAQRAKVWKSLRVDFYARGLITFDPRSAKDTWAKVPLEDKLTMYKMAFVAIKLHPLDFESMMKSRVRVLCMRLLSISLLLTPFTFLSRACSIL